MPKVARRTLLRTASSLVVFGTLTASGFPDRRTVLAQTTPQNSQHGIKALFFDVFGTLVDWRTGVARETEAILKPHGYGLDWFAFADAWRAQYGPGMEEVRTGKIPFVKLDVIHRRMLDRIVPQFGLEKVSGGVLDELNLAWHRLDGWPDVASGLARLGRRFVLAPVSNGNISLMADLARRNGWRWDAVLGAEIAGD